ncbi:MAG: PAS domain-containing protein [Spirochaetia bacterium]|nr:PAS domain-containing protein [Spirochaetia bacterium]
MTGKKLRGLLYPKIAVTVILIVAFSIIFISVTSRRFVLEQSIENLDETAVIVRNLLEEDILNENYRDNSQLQVLFEHLSINSLSRITYILPDGQVAADTDENPDSMENHRNRPEVLRALSGISSSNVRFSETLKIDMLYHAVPIVDNNGKVAAVLRIAMPFNRVKRTFSVVLIYVLIGSFTFIALSIFLVLYIDRKIERPLAELAAEAGIDSGLKFGKSRPVHSPSIEIQNLYTALKTMSIQLNNQINDISIQKQELQAVLDSMDNAILVLNSHGAIIKTNPAALELFQAAVESELLGKYYMQAASNKTLNTVLEKVIRGSGSDSAMQLPLPSERFEITIRERSFQVYVSVVSPEPERTILIVFNDITRLLHLEKVRRDFVANVSHELKTPVTSIKGFTETLLYQEFKPDDVRIKKFLNIIFTQTNRLQDIIEDLLTLSMLEQNDATQNMQKISIQNLIKDSVRVCVEKTAFNGREIDINCTESVLVQCNPLLIEQALINLIDNALKYSDPTSPVTVCCSIKHGNAVISVCDKGFGIPEDLIPRIFERFYRVDKGRSREKGGTGLGLAIVKHIMLRHNGSVHVESQEGAGSTFYLSLPLET